MILAWLSASFIVGVVLGQWATPSTPLALACSISLCALAYVFRSRRWGATLLVASALLVGIIRSPHVGQPSPSDLRYYNGRVVMLVGVVSAEPDVRDRGASYEVSVDTLARGTVSRTVSGKVQVRSSSFGQPLEYGDKVRLMGKLQSFGGITSTSYRQALARKGIYSQINFPRLSVMGSQSGGWSGWIMRLRQYMESRIDAALPEPEAALLIAITLGARSATLGDLAPVLVATGIIHIIAISGIKVAMVAGTLWGLARRLRFRLFRLGLTLSALYGYVALTGWTPSGVRSALMWTLVFVATYLGRSTVALVSLGFAAALMVSIDPSLPWDIGFQLSVIGTLAIVTYTQPILTILALFPSALVRLSRREAGRDPTVDIGSPLRAGLSLLSAPFRQSFAVTLAAQLGTLPIVIGTFNVAPKVGVISNAIVLPLLPATIALGFVLGSGATSVVLAPVAALAYALTHLIIWVCNQLASVSGTGRANNLSPILTACYYAAGIGLAWLVLRKANFAPVGEYVRRRGEVLVGVVVALVVVTFSTAFTRSDPHTRLYGLATGQAKLLRSGGVTVLVDGSSRPFQLMERLGAILPYQKRTIDLVIVTNSAAGNITGLQAVLRHYLVGEVVDVGAEHPSATYASWRAALRSRHIPTYALRTGMRTTVGSVQVASLGPDTVCAVSTDCSGLLRLTGEHSTILLAGAASTREQHEALFRTLALGSQMLVLDTPQLDRGFLREVNPRLVIMPRPAQPGSRGPTDGQRFSLDV